jgi:gliding motility-associated-like protein
MNYLIKAPLKGSEYSYRWQDGSTDSIFSASHTASYVLYITKGNCTATDTINVNFFQIKSNMPDTFICKGMPIDVQLSVNVPQGGTVLWNDGITNPVRTVHDSGTWWVYISKDECMALDTVRVITGYCDCWYNVPGGFTPNGDGLNDVFKPTIEPGCTISGYQFSVYNRWGEELYTSDFRGKGWDGTYKGEPVDLGVYMYSVQFFIGVHDKPVLKTGAVTLIR